MAKEDLELPSALYLLDYSNYFNLRQITQPTDINGIAPYLSEERIIVKQDNGLYAITNLVAMLFDKQLSDFPRLSRKAVRVVQYQGGNRLNMLKEETFEMGYASAFSGMIKYIEALIPTCESITGALREKQSAYP